jgi:predicted RNA-binding Zn-ribbon protein involved in translation (DUF1610 family)
MDVQATCPRCHERQPLADPAGYTCARCGAEWVFVRCDACGSRFHMQPGVTTWTCPSCGANHGPAARTRTPRPAPSIGRGTLLAGVAGLVILLVAVWAIFLRSPGGAPAHSGGSTSSRTLQQLCSDIPLDLVVRAAALGREEAAVRDDAKALKAAGASAEATQATTLADALGTLRHDLITHADTATATLKVQQALGALPC